MCTFSYELSRRDPFGTCFEFLVSGSKLGREDELSGGILPKIAHPPAPSICKRGGFALVKGVSSLLTTRRFSLSERASGMEMTARRRVMCMGVNTRMIGQEGTFVLETT